MTEPAPLLPPPDQRLTRYGQLRDSILGSPDWGRMIGWFAPLVITLLAAVLRLVNVGHPHQLAFDETYYVKDAWSLWTLGYEGTCCFNYKLVDGAPVILELNPRFGGSLVGDVAIYVAAHLEAIGSPTR